MSMAGSLRATFSPDLGIDLGTANTVVYSHDEGVLVSEPSVVAYRTSDDAIIAVGRAAKELDGRAPGRIKVVRPLRGGTISDFRGAHALVKTMVDRAMAARPRVAPFRGGGPDAAALHAGSRCRGSTRPWGGGPPVG